MTHFVQPAYTEWYGLWVTIIATVPSGLMPSIWRGTLHQFSLRVFFPAMMRTGSTDINMCISNRIYPNGLQSKSPRKTVVTHRTHKSRWKLTLLNRTHIPFCSDHTLCQLQKLTVREKLKSELIAALEIRHSRSHQARVCRVAFGRDDHITSPRMTWDLFLGPVA